MNDFRSRIMIKTPTLMLTLLSVLILTPSLITSAMGKETGSGIQVYIRKVSASSNLFLRKGPFEKAGILPFGKAPDGSPGISGKQIGDFILKQFPRKEKQIVAVYALSMEPGENPEEAGKSSIEVIPSPDGYYGNYITKDKAGNPALYLDMALSPILLKPGEKVQVWVRTLPKQEPGTPSAPFNASRYNKKGAITAGKSPWGMGEITGRHVAEFLKSENIATEDMRIINPETGVVEFFFPSGAAFNGYILAEKGELRVYVDVLGE
jgi:hypothetical protein